MRKIILTIVIIFKVVLITTLLVWIGNKAQAQDFDRDLQKTIKTEINLNRIAKSQDRLHLSNYYQKRADSVNLVTFQSYLANAQTTSLGHQEDWSKIWAPVEHEMDKAEHANYNVILIVDGDYKKKLRDHLFDKNAFYYKLEHTEVSLSAIRYDNKIFLTVLTW